MNISKFNFGSRQFYSITDALLEKRLMYSTSMLTKQKTVYVVTDLAACYDRQLSNYESLVLEYVGVDRNIALLIAKVLPIFNHHVCTGFGISKGSYGSETEILGGTGQGNLASCESCKVKSSRIIGEIKKDKLGVTISRLIT